MLNESFIRQTRDLISGVQNVVKTFGNVVAVNHVTLGIKDGEFFSLPGPSGGVVQLNLRKFSKILYWGSGSIFHNASENFQV